MHITSFCASLPSRWSPRISAAQRSRSNLKGEWTNVGGASTMSIPGMPPGPIPGSPGSPEWLAQQAMMQQLATNTPTGLGEGLEQTLNIHIVPTKGQRRVRLVIGVVMAVTFVAFIVVFVVVATHILHSGPTP
jgi:hypothetical protein